MAIHKKIPRFTPSLAWGDIFFVLRKIIYACPCKETGVGNKFEQIFANFIESKHAISAVSGRLALYSILKNLKIKDGAEILLPSFTYWAIPSLVRSLKFNPIFVDIDPNTYNIDYSLIEEKITSKTRVVVPTHLYGLPCKMDRIKEIAKKHNLVVIEDCVQACGAEYMGRKTGSWGDAAYFSFDITKKPSLLGGGMIVTSLDFLSDDIRREAATFGYLGNVGLAKKLIQVSTMKVLTDPYIFSLFLYPIIYGFSGFGIDIVHSIFSEKESFEAKNLEIRCKLMPVEIQQELGIKEMGNLCSIIKLRKRNAGFLYKKLEGVKGITLPEFSENNIYITFPIRVRNRDKFMRALLKKGVDTTSGYMKPFGQDCYKARKLYEEIVHLPIYPSLGFEELEFIADSIKQVCREVGL